MKMLAARTKGELSADWSGVVLTNISETISHTVGKGGKPAPLYRLTEEGGALLYFSVDLLLWRCFFLSMNPRYLPNCSVHVASKF